MWASRLGGRKMRCGRDSDLDEIVFVDDLRPPVVIHKRGIVDVVTMHVEADLMLQISRPRGASEPLR